MIHAVEAPEAPPPPRVARSNRKRQPQKKKKEQAGGKKHTEEAGVISLDWPLLTRSTAGAVKPPESGPDPTRLCDPVLSVLLYTWHKNEHVLFIKKKLQWSFYLPAEKKTDEVSTSMWAVALTWDWIPCDTWPADIYVMWHRCGSRSCCCCWWWSVSSAPPRLYFFITPPRQWSCRWRAGKKVWRGLLLLHLFF